MVSSGEEVRQTMGPRSALGAEVFPSSAGGGRSPPKERWRMRLWVVLISINAAFLAFSLSNLHRSRIRYEERAQTDTRNMTAAVTDSVKGALDAIDIELRSLSKDPWIRDILLAGSAEQKQALLRVSRDKQNVVRAFRYFDETGALKASSDETGASANVAQRLLFRSLQASGSDGLAISKPVQSASSRDWMVVLAYRIVEGGVFRGVVSATVPLDHFDRFLTVLDLGSSGAVSIRGLDNAVIARIPKAMPTTAEEPVPSATNEARAAQNSPSATYVSKAQWDGVLRTVSYQRVGDYPFRVYLGLAAEDYLAPWRVERNSTYFAVLVFAVATSLLMGFVGRGIRRYERTASELLDQESRFRSLLESASDALLVLDAGGLVQMANRRAEELVQASHGSLQGTSISQWLSRRQRIAYLIMVSELTDGAVELEGTDRRHVLVRRQDGGRIPVAVAVRRMEGIQGALLVLYVRDITEQREALQKMLYLSAHDALTGLPNRQMAVQLLRRTIERAEQNKNLVAVVHLGLDHFKSINDAQSHAVGDRYLQAIAKRLGARRPGPDAVSRLSGDEFMLVYALDAKSRDLRAVLQQLMVDLRIPVSVDGKALSTTASAGVALYPQDGQSAELLAQRASLAMTHAKSLGRDRFCYFHPATDAEVQERHLLFLHLRKALWEGEFALHYQPIMALATGEMVAVEALLRWTNSELGVIGPNRFIPVAEETGLIGEIGAWVLDEACRQSAVWRAAGVELPIAVNLSATQFQRDELDEVEQLIMGTLRKHALPTQALQLELTESVLLHDTEKVLACLQRLKARGLQISIDDFGTGYSSLSYLRRLDANKVKIDQSFVRSLTGALGDVAIVRAIIQMAHSLGLEVVAEGVETVEILQVLQSLACDSAQGYLFARPAMGDNLDLATRIPTTSTNGL